MVAGVMGPLPPGAGPARSCVDRLLPGWRPGAHWGHRRGPAGRHACHPRHSGSLRWQHRGEGGASHWCWPGERWRFCGSHGPRFLSAAPSASRPVGPRVPTAPWPSHLPRPLSEAPGLAVPRPRRLGAPRRRRASLRTGGAVRPASLGLRWSKAFLRCHFPSGLAALQLSPAAPVTATCQQCLFLGFVPGTYWVSS